MQKFEKEYFNDIFMEYGKDFDSIYKIRLLLIKVNLRYYIIQ